MNPIEGLRMSWRAVRAHRLRSALTTLGVVIGVAAVIAFVTLGASLQTEIVGELTGQQAPAMQVTVGPEQTTPGPPGAGSQAVFTEYDADQLAAIEGVAAVVPVGDVGISGVTHQGQTLPYNRLTASTPPYFEYVSTATFAAGGPYAAGEPEVVLNERAATLFDRNVSVGDTVTVVYADGDRVNATVTGVLAAETGAFGGFSFPRVYAPVDPFYGTRLERPGTDERQRVYPTLTVVAADFAELSPVRERVLAYLESSSDARRLKPASYAFRAQTAQELVDQVLRVLNTFTAFVTGVAVISLVVGAIGIANIMLVSVTERTREIGIMKAVGAQNRDVLQLFLTEAVLLGLVGAILGTGVGILGGYVATRYVDLPLTVPLEWTVVAVVVGLLVGVVAGLYPAWNAARTDPIEALRYE